MSEKDLEYAKNIGRVDFYPNDFDNAVQQHGAKVLWERSMLCSCISEDSGQPDFNDCPGCRGKGYTYFDPKEIKALASSMAGKKDHIPIGLLDVGTTMLTTSSMDRIGFRDRITFLDMKTTYSQVVTFTDNPEGELLKYDCVDMVSVRVLNTEIPESAYTVNGNRIKFQNNVVGYGERFSVLMMVRPTYVVIDMPHELRGQYVKFNHAVDTWYELPKQHMIKREDLMPMSRGQLL
jgi:hypothetical protein